MNALTIILSVAGLALASAVKAALLPKYHELRTSADGDTIIVRVKCSKREKAKTVEEIKEKL